MAARRRFSPAVLALAALTWLPLSAAKADPLAGTWRAPSVEIMLGADGQFERRDRGVDGVVMTVTGSWTMDGPGPWLRLTFEDWAPRRACGLFGCTPIRMRAGETYRVIRQDGDHLLIEDPGGRIALHRGG